jgi:hypothetical protein
MGFTVERLAYIEADKLVSDLLLDLSGNGFNVIHPSGGITPTTTEATLEATAAVDPLIGGAVPPEEQQPWRLKVKWDEVTRTLHFWAACPQQLDEEGGTADYSYTYESGGMVDDLERLPNLYPPGADRPPLGQTQIPQDNFSQYPPFFFHRYYENNSRDSSGDMDYHVSPWDDNAHPLAYRLSISDHGIAFMIWDESLHGADRYFNWFVVQRPVDSVTGDTLVTGKAPLFCVYSVGGTDDRTYRFTVRERDVHCPDLPRLAFAHGEDHHAILNNAKQVAITENDNYVLTFPNGLNTRRYMYTEELDMIAFTSADVISQWADAELAVYGEGSPRIYKAMHSNGENNTGMRLLMLTSGGGV